MSEKVYVSRSNRTAQRRYHTERNCQYIRDIEVRYVEKDKLEPHHKECKLCSGEADTGGGKSKFHELIREAERNEN